ncbi:beta-ketoacyl synthase N-terminal-like domain-containing protein [Candidatus Margulisiibacteriota bacterium]
MQKNSSKLKKNKISKNDIAIIGLVGKFPQADNKWEFWQNLKTGKDCITEIPKERWDYEKFFLTQDRVKDINYCKWGGFINDVDKFEPSFFDITPYDAEHLDPQVRLMIESSWAVMEDAGYTPKKLIKGDKKANPIGVFISISSFDYSYLGIDADEKDYLITTSTPWSIPNAVSYLFNFTGPSLAIDSACSSSLLALHLACESLKRNECKAALVGGINLILHPIRYQILTKYGLLSAAGRCKSFGKGADGYVSSEGAISILIKPLSQAVADKDYIYGVIKATSINHGGNVRTFTAPHPDAQAEVIKNTYQKAKIDPKTINYLEAHGTGTAIGDPIELLGLKKAFGQHKKPFCALGSVKSNLGHLEGVAGLAGLAKVLMQLQYNKLAPSIHTKELNPKLNFDGSGFYVQRKMEKWKGINYKGRKIPRRAGISAFGAGGTNSHLIIEEYKRSAKKKKITAAEQIIIFSAKTKQSLRSNLKNILNLLNTPEDNIDFNDLAYTLQTGRQEMKERLAVIVSSLPELKKVLSDYLSDKIDRSKMFLNPEKTQNTGFINSFTNDPEAAKLFKSWIKNKEFFKIAQLWAQGLTVDWNLFWTGLDARIIPLPTYSFVKEHYWLCKTDDSLFDLAHKSSKPKLHPLIDKNISNIQTFAFEKEINKENFYWKGNNLGQKPFFPPVALLEIALAAGNILNKSSAVWKISEVTWQSPLTLNANKQKLFIEINKQKEKLLFKVFSKETGQEKVNHIKGSLIYRSPEISLKKSRKNIIKLKKQTNSQNSSIRNISKLKAVWFGIRAFISKY